MIWVLFLHLFVAVYGTSQDGNLRMEKNLGMPSSLLGSLLSDGIITALSSSKPDRGIQDELASKSNLFPLIGLDSKLLSSTSVGGVPEAFAGILNGGWRSFGRSFNQGSIPAVGTVVERLTSARSSVNSLETELQEAASVLEVLPNLRQSLQHIPLSPIRSQMIVGGWGASGVFGIQGLLRSMNTEFVASGNTFFESLLRKPSVLNSRQMASGIDSLDLASPQFANLTKEVENMSRAHARARMLGAQTDSLITLFSGGIQIPFIHSLSSLEECFSQLSLAPSDVQTWTKTVALIQQLREDLVRLPFGWSLSASQTASVESSVANVDSILAKISSYEGVMNIGFFNEIAGALQALGSSIVQLDGTALIPKIVFNNIDVSGLFKNVNEDLAMPISLRDLSSLSNGFGLNLPVVGQTLAKRASLTLEEQDTTGISQKFFSDLVARTFLSVPSMLAESVKVGGILSSVKDGLIPSMELTSNLAGASFLNRNMFPFTVDSNRDPNVQHEKERSLKRPGFLVGDTRFLFVKVLQLESAMNSVQNLIDCLLVFPEPLASRLISANPKGIPPIEVNVGWSFFVDYLRSVRNSEVRRPAPFVPIGLQTPITGLSLLDRIPGSSDIKRLLGLPRHRRLQETIQELTLNVTSIDVESLALFSAFHVVLQSLHAVDLIVQDTLEVRCYSEAEMEALMSVRAAALLGNPVDVLKTLELPDKDIVEVLGGSSSEVHQNQENSKSESLGSLVCQKKRSALKALQQWAGQVESAFGGMLEHTLQMSTESVDVILSTLEALGMEKQEK